MDVIFIVGAAGAGKSMMANTLNDTLNADGWDTAIMNLDPFSDNLIYEPTIDVRNYIDRDELSKKYGLGANGALVFSMDLIATMIDNMLSELENIDYLIVDTPGQMELFLFRQSGQYLFKKIGSEGKALLFVSDVFLLSNINNFITMQLLFSLLASKFNYPAMHAINKIDLDSMATQKVKNWYSNPETFETDLNKNSLVFSKVYRTVRSSGLLGPVFFTSAINGRGIVELKAEISRIFKGGEDKKE
jgi:GTPase SAR1 family protein